VVDSQLYEINGLPLPLDLVRLIEAGRWNCPHDLAGVNALFPERGDFTLYSLATMRRENASWRAETRRMFLGAKDPLYLPGDLDPQQSVLVGDLGIGYDQPIALDYRTAPHDPPVVTL
jgi:hypothetical protein